MIYAWGHERHPIVPANYWAGGSLESDQRNDDQRGTNDRGGGGMHRSGVGLPDLRTARPFA